MAACREDEQFAVGHERAVKSTRALCRHDQVKLMGFASVKIAWLSQNDGVGGSEQPMTIWKAKKSIK
jgi:hypothetical protein